MINFNTSYVNVKPIRPARLDIPNPNFNTSYVNVKPR